MGYNEVGEMYRLNNVMSMIPLRHSIRIRILTHPPSN